MRELGEMVSSVNIIECRNVEELRNKFADVLENFNYKDAYMFNCAPGYEFQFISCRTVAFPLPHRAASLKEFEEIFGKIFQEEPPKAPQPEEVFEEAKSYETIIPENYKPEYESLEVIEEEDTKSLETIIGEEKLPVKNQEPIMPEEHYETQNEILEGFEMQKAIVYAEIINRKYF
jgi:hypothetical protein